MSARCAPLPVAHVLVRCVHCGIEIGIPTTRSARMCTGGRVNLRELLDGATAEAQVWLHTTVGAHAGMGHVTTDYYVRLLSPGEQADSFLAWPDAWQAAS